VRSFVSRTSVVRPFLIVVALTAADLADGATVLDRSALAWGLFIVDLFLLGCLFGWLLSRLARSAPVIDTVMMTWFVPYLGSFELVRKSRARLEAAEAELAGLSWREHETD
jgi:hypothetical protein